MIASSPACCRHSTYSRCPRPPPSSQYAQWDGFGKTGTIIAVSLLVSVGIASYLLVSYFRRLNARKEAASVAAKKAADARYLAEGGASATASGTSLHTHGHDNESGGLKQSLLRA